MSDIRELQEIIVTFRDARDWKQFHNPKDVALSLVLEATEVLEHFQWKNEAQALKHLEINKEDVGEELADVLYWVLLLSHDSNIDIVEALKKKMEKNDKKYPVEKSKGNSAKYTEL